MKEDGVRVAGESIQLIIDEAGGPLRSPQRPD